MNSNEAVFTLRGNKGVVLGTGILNINTNAKLEAASDTWSENVTVKLLRVTGQVKQVNAGFTAGCDAGCTMAQASAWVGSKTLKAGQSAVGKVIFKAKPPAGGRSQVTTNYALRVTQTGTLPTKPTTSWPNPKKVRCDSEVGGTTGCVYDFVRANVDYALSQYGAAAATYAYAQNKMIDHWGAPDNPLTRDGDAATAKARRNRTCMDKSSIPFVPFADDIVQGDSCDEYPFAGTLQGGSDGGMCAEIVPQFANGKWSFFQADDKRPVTGNEPCVRGHVPLAVNKAAGGKYGSAVQTERILNYEKFTVSVRP